MKRLMISTVSALMLAGLPLESFAQDYSLCKSLDPAHVSVDHRASISNFKPAEAYRLCRKFVEVDAAIPNFTPVRKNGETDQHRLENILIYYPWYQSRILRSYIEMYEATGEARFLEKMIADIDVLEADATIQGTYPDGGYGWPAKSKQDVGANNCSRTTNCVLVGGDPYIDDNGDGKPDYTRKVVHSGNLLYPIARLVELLEEDPELDSQLDPEFRGRSDRYLQLIINVINTHNAEFCAAGRTDCGTSGRVSATVKPIADVAYYFTDTQAKGFKSRNKGWNLPTNQQAVMGSVLAILWGLDDSDRDNPLGRGTNNYRDMTKGLARAFWRDIRYRPNDDGHGQFAVWHYWWGQSLNRSSKYEDISHAGLDIEFLVEMRRQGFNARNSSWPFPWGNETTRQGVETIAQNDDILRAFANTFTEAIYLGGNDKLANRVDGSLGQTTKNGIKEVVYGDLRSAFNFLDLAEWDNDVYSFSNASNPNPDSYIVVNNASLPNKVYSIVKCLYDENADTFPNDRLLHHGLARLTKWAVKTSDNDNADDRRIRCDATRTSDDFYTDYMTAYLDKLSGR